MSHQVDEQPRVPARASRPTSSTRRERRVAGRGCAGPPRSPEVPQPCRPSPAARGRPSNASAESRVTSTSAASASSPSSSARARAISECRSTSSSRLNIQKQHAAKPSWATASVSRSPRPRPRPGRTTRPPRPVPRRGGSARESTVARARSGPGASGAITSRSCASARRESPDSKCRYAAPTARRSASSRRSDGVNSLARSSMRAADRGAPRRRACCCGVLERVGHRLVRRPDRGGQLPGARLGVVEKLGEPSVNLDPPTRSAVSYAPAARSGCVNRMRSRRAR